MTSGGSGVIKSPNYHHKYTTNITCEWTIWGRSKLSRILLTFDVFGIEGNPLESWTCYPHLKNFVINAWGYISLLLNLKCCESCSQGYKLSTISDHPEIGCGNAVLKIYTTRSGMPTYEICGENRSMENFQIISQTNVLRLKFDKILHWFKHS